MEHTYEELKKKNVSQLREIAKDIDHEAVHGYTTMHKEHLLHAICIALGLDEHVHHEVVGIDKAKVKGQIKELKAERDRILALEDKAERRKQLKPVLRRIHELKRRIHKATR